MLLTDGAPLPWLLGLVFLLIVLGLTLGRRRARHAGQGPAVRLPEGDRATRLQNERLQLALRGGGFGVWEYDVAAARFEVDVEQSRLYGLEPVARQASFEAWQRAVHRDDLARVRDWFRDTLERQAPYDMTYRIVLPDHTVRWVRSLGKAQTDAAGRIERIVGVDRDVTEQEEASLRLRQLSERMLMAAGAARLGIWELDGASGIVTADETARQLFGLPREGELRRDDIRACLHADDRQVIRELIDHGLRSAEPVEATFRVDTSPGEPPRTLRSAASMPRDKDGVPRRMVGVCWDVSGDVALQRELAESGQRLGLALQAAAGAAWLVQGQDRRLRWSEHWIDIYGVADDAPAEAWLGQVLPEDRAATEAAWQRALQDGGEPAFAFEFRIRHARRGLRHLRCVGQCEFTPDGRLLRAVGVDMDVTSQRETAFRVKQLSERLDLAASASGMGVWQYEPRSGSLWADARHAGLFGLESGAGEVQLASWQQRVAEADRVALAALVQGGADAPERLELTLLPLPGPAADAGAGRRLRLMVQQVRDAQGAVQQRVGASFDITTEWQAQQAIERARREAEAASRSKSAFLANMSHEIRTPMNAVIGLTGLLQDAVHEQPARDYVHKAHAAARGLLAVLDDVLDLSKIEAGKLALERTEFRLEDVLATVCDTLSYGAEAKGLRLRAELGAGLGGGWSGDRVRLQQVLLNLGANAVKFTEHGEVVLRAVGPAGRLRFEVEDTGIGLDAGAQQRIFEAFEQADVSTARRFGGTGLGLTICRHLVTLMGGSLHVRSALGQGTCFWFALRHLQPLDEPLPVSAVPDAAPRLLGATVLLVEDNELNRLVAAAMLEQLGVVTLVADSGEAALKLLVQQPVDAVLMDIQMPGMDGLEATRRLRALPGAAGRVPVIAMTAHAMAGDRELSLAAGMNDHVTKPIERDALARVLVGWMPERR